MKLIRDEPAFSCFTEIEIAKILDNFNIKYYHESQVIDQILDFYLPDYKIYIEVKQYPSDRTIRQLMSQENIILVQGKGSINFLKKILKII